MKGLFLFLSLVFVSCELQVIDNSTSIDGVNTTILDIKNINMINKGVYVNGVLVIEACESSTYRYTYETTDKFTDIFIFIDMDGDGIESNLDYIYDGTIDNSNIYTVIDDWNIKQE